MSLQIKEYYYFKSPERQSTELQLPSNLIKVLNEERKGDRFTGLLTMLLKIFLKGTQMPDSQETEQKSCSC